MIAITLDWHSLPHGLAAEHSVAALVKARADPFSLSALRFDQPALSQARPRVPRSCVFLSQRAGFPLSSAPHE
jgi:hypothetical protein